MYAANTNRPSFTSSGLPFDDVFNLIHTMPQGDEISYQKALNRELDLINKPHGTLGQLEKIAAWLSKWQHRHPPQLMQANVVIFATSHGLAQHNISRFSGKGIDNIEIVKQNVHLLQNGESPVNVFCDQAGAGLKVFELGIEIPTADITEQAAMTEREAVATIAYGMEAAASGGDLLVVGETSVAGSTIASSLCAALFDEAPSYWVGNGTGITTEFYAKKVGLVAKAIELHKSSQGKPLEILRCLGGREIAAIIGAIIAARHQNIPVLLDGYVSVAAAAVLWEIDANSIDHCCFADCTQERGHQRLLEKMSKKTLTQYGIHLGQGAGAVLSINIMKAAAQYHMFGKTDQSQKSTILAVS